MHEGQYTHAMGLASSLRDPRTRWPVIGALTFGLVALAGAVACVVSVVQIWQVGEVGAWYALAMSLVVAGCVGTGVSGALLARANRDRGTSS